MTLITFTAPAIIMSEQPIKIIFLSVEDIVRNNSAEELQHELALLDNDLYEREA